MLCGGEGSRREQCQLLDSWLAFILTSPATHKQIGPFWCWFLGGWVCVCSRTLWVSPTNSPVSLGVSSAASTPTGFFQSQVLRLYFPTLEPWVAWSVSLPSCSFQFICVQIWDLQVCQPLPGPVLQLPISSSPTGLDECFFFNYLVVRLSNSSVFWQFSLFLVLNLLLFFFWSWEEPKRIRLCLSLVQQSST